MASLGKAQSVPEDSYQRFCILSGDELSLFKTVGVGPFGVGSKPILCFALFDGLRAGTGKVDQRFPALPFTLRAIENEQVPP